MFLDQPYQRRMLARSGERLSKNAHTEPIVRPKERMWTSLRYLLGGHAQNPHAVRQLLHLVL
jgi:hypothetical protein